MANTINIMTFQIADAQLREHKPDVIIKPKLGYVGLFDYQEAEDVMRVGYEQTMRQMSEIEALF
jgi:NTE family protein